MLKAYLSVIHASLILADMHGYHAQLSTVASCIDMISVIFIKGKSLKLHAPVSIHTMSISTPRRTVPIGTMMMEYKDILMSKEPKLVTIMENVETPTAFTYLFQNLMAQL